MTSVYLREGGRGGRKRGGREGGREKERKEERKGGEMEQEGWWEKSSEFNVALYRESLLKTK